MRNPLGLFYVLTTFHLFHDLRLRYPPPPPTSFSGFGPLFALTNKPSLVVPPAVGISPPFYSRPPPPPPLPLFPPFHPLSSHYQSSHPPPPCPIPSEHLMNHKPPGLPTPSHTKRVLARCIPIGRAGFLRRKQLLRRPQAPLGCS